MDTYDLPWTEGEIHRIRSRLLRFFDERKRTLPWRESAAPWGVLVSEVMSQQTRVETVVPYYRRWMERFPEPADLAEARQEEVLALWEGLGYYSRARNLHRTAKELAERYDGRVPEDPEALRSLPGVGPYTAGAVASIAFGVPVPAVDGNVRRVLARLLDEPRPTPSALEGWAATLVDPDRPGEFNQALMELGSLVCRPRSPRCDRCPVAGYCASRAAGTVLERPAPRRRGAVPHRQMGVVVPIRREEGGGGAVWRFLLRRRPEAGLLGGMWEFPARPFDPTEGETPGAAAAGLLGSLGLHGAPGEGPDEGPACRPLAAVDHAFSHFRVTYHPFLHVAPAPGHDPAPEPAGKGGGARWVTAEELGSLPLPVAQRRILRLARGFIERRGGSGDAELSRADPQTETSSCSTRS
jgi:A/G-specific adenine glycosylase